MGLFAARSAFVREGATSAASVWLGAELSRRIAEIEALPSGRAFSLTLRLPDSLFGALADWGGDWVWRAPNDDLEFFARGAVAGIAGAADWRRHSRSWAVLGDAGPPPLAFLTAPPLGGAVRLHLPSLLLRSHRAEKWLVLNGFRDSSPAPSVAGAWLDLFGAPRRRPVAWLGRGAAFRAYHPGPELWRARVADATQAIAQGQFSKVVLARKIVVAAPGPIDADRILRELAAENPEARIFQLPHENGLVLAASPELLAVKRGDEITSHALAGTARRFPDAAADRSAVKALFASPKERREHEIVARGIEESLRLVCDGVSRESAPKLMRLRGLQHLWTPVSGRLRQNFDLLDVIPALHPTPAVLGFPGAAARDWLEGVEERRDGLYTGLAGWVDLDGDGEAAVVLRSAFIEGSEARLWAGAGIMAESRAEAEWDETGLKMDGLLRRIEAGA